MRLLTAAVAVMLLASMVSAQNGVIDIPLDPLWGATPEWTGRDKAKEFDAAYQDGYASFTASGGGRTMVWAKHPDPPLDTSKMRYLTMRYRAANLDDSLWSYLLYINEPGDTGMRAHNLAVGAGDLIHDGQWHTATTQLHPFEQVATMALRFRALEGTEGRLDVAYLRFTAEPPRVRLDETLDWRECEASDDCVPMIDLKGTDLAELSRALDLADWFTSEDVEVNGVPFRVSLAGATALSTGKAELERITVPVGRKAASLCLLMGSQFPYKMLNYANWFPGDTTARPEQFLATVHYAGGSSEEQIPYCLGLKRHGLWRGLQAYALSVDPGKEVADLELWDRMRTSAFHLVAVTARDTDLIPAQTEEPWRIPPALPAEAPANSIKLDGDRLVVASGGGTVQLGTTPETLGVVAIANQGHPGCTIRPEQVSLFSIRSGDDLWTAADFTFVEAFTVDGRRAACAMRSEGAQLEVRLSVDVGGPEARYEISVTNLAAEDRTLDVTFPRVRLAAARDEALWYFYPRMCVAWSNIDTRLREPHSGYFPMQFLDVYDRDSGGGLHFGTRDRTLRQKYYRLDKANATIDARIEYEFNPTVGAGQTVVYPATVIEAHSGDWREAARGYLAWLQTWYSPAKPRIDWYQKVWNFRTWWTHTMGDGRAEWNLFDLENEEYQVDEFVKRDREKFGDVDMVHFFDWRISRDFGRWGDYSHYEDIGGLEKFRGMVRGLQAQGIRVGLYMDPYLCSRKSEIGKAHGEEWALHRVDGRVGDSYSSEDDPMLNMCVLHPGWQDYMAQRCAQVARETGCNGIYLDESMADLDQYWCWREDHGHVVPGVNQLGLAELSEKVRAALPDDVAFYAEWTPPDVLIPQLDGSYQASLSKSPQHEVSPGLVQIVRFVFPDFKIFTISNGGSMYDGIWGALKYSLFSGVPLYSLSWGHDPDALPFVRKISGILHEHEDAFLTTTPEPFVETERRDLFCNVFPGEIETVWTLWNGRYRTVEGPLLRVKHVAGARYLDLWNETELTPDIEGGMATLSGTVGPQSVGAIAQIR